MLSTMAKLGLLFIVGLINYINSISSANILKGLQLKWVNVKIDLIIESKHLPRG